VVAAAEQKGTYPERTLRDSTQLNLRAPEVLSLAGAVIPDQATADSAALAEPTAELPARSTRSGLPRRVRPESQSPDDPAAADAPGPAPRRAPVAAPAPEDARGLAASLQSSWLRSRQPDDFTPSERPATQQDAMTPDSASDSEEA